MAEGRGSTDSDIWIKIIHIRSLVGPSDFLCHIVLRVF
jgi:hypothetical protein